MKSLTLLTQNAQARSAAIDAILATIDVEPIYEAGLINLSWDCGYIWLIEVPDWEIQDVIERFDLEATPANFFGLCVAAIGYGELAQVVGWLPDELDLLFIIDANIDRPVNRAEVREFLGMDEE